MKRTDVLIKALEYIKRFKGQIFVIKLGGELILDKSVLDAVAQDLILLDFVGIHPVVVHGGGPEITKAMERFGKKPEFVKGLRVTDEETMDIVKMVLIGKVNTEIVACINKHGGRSVGLSGKSGSLFIAVKKKNKEVDIGLVGEIKKVNPHVVTTQIDNGYIPVISPVGFAEDGGSLNINADTATAELAVALKATKIMFLTNVKGVLDSRGRLIKRLTIPEAQKLIKDNIISGGMIPKISACIHSLKKGVERSHIIKAERHAILEEVLTSTGTGTMITATKIVGE